MWRCARYKAGLDCWGEASILQQTNFILFSQTLTSECHFFKFPIYITNPLRSRNLRQCDFIPLTPYTSCEAQSSLGESLTRLPSSHRHLYSHFLYSLEEHGLENTKYTESFLIWWHPIYNQPRSLAKSPKPHSIRQPISKGPFALPSVCWSSTFSSCCDWQKTSSL